MKKLVFENCCQGLEAPKEGVIPLIAGLRDGLFPNLEEFVMPRGELMVGQVAQLAKVLREGAPCARTLRTVVLSKECEPADIEVLQAALPNTTVVLG